MKMKLLDCTLVSLLIGNPVVVIAQTRSDAPTIHCDASGCHSEQGLLFRVRPGTAVPTPPGRAAAPLETPGKFSATFPNGGIFWATEDPNPGQPELAASAPAYVAFDGTRIIKPVQFYARSNYAAFLNRFEILVYRGTDIDLLQPIARLPVEAASLASVRWEPELPAQFRFRTGDTLLYVLRAYDEDGNFDETYPHSLLLASPQEEDRGQQLLRDASQRLIGGSLTSEQAQTQSLLNDVMDNNGLRRQTIPVRGSLVRLRGRDIPQGYSLRINGDEYPVDPEGNFFAQYLFPVGQHQFDIELRGPGGPPVAKTLDVEVSGQYFFATAIADITISQNKITGAESANLDDRRSSEDILRDGRLAGYLKARLGGKYLLTAQADTTERDIARLFHGFTRADPQDIFMRLDPDQYYPTYGDDSSIYRDVDTMGRFYLRLDWDRNQALWGNYQTNLNDTEYSQYIRSLYGAAVDWHSRSFNRWGEPRTEVRAFGANVETAPGHSEFIGTGGSLYYLRHSDLLPGSEILNVELRDPTTGRVEQRTQLVRGADYEIDELQGRILLQRPLAQTVRDGSSTITQDRPLDGYDQFLVVDYEWEPTGFDEDEAAAGGRAKQWFGDHVALGGTYVQESRAGEDYTLSGSNLTLQAAPGTYIKAEYNKTEATSAPVFFSDNGGFTFRQLNPDGPREGTARTVEARLNTRELGWTRREWRVGAWWRRIDAGYSISRNDLGVDIEETGVEVFGQVTDDLSLYARHTYAERGGQSLEQTQLTGQWRLGDFRSLSGEVRRVEENRGSGNAAGTLGALRYQDRVGERLDLYGIAQLTLDDDNGRYPKNNAFTVGGKYLFANNSSIGAETTAGDRGNATRLNAEYQLRPDHTLYGSYTFSTDRSSAYDSQFNTLAQNGWTLGQRWSLSSQTQLFNESQYLKNTNESGLSHLFGMDFYPAQGKRLGFTLQQGELDLQSGGQVQRKAVSLSGGITNARTNWQSKLEWRRDSGAEQRDQWVTANWLNYRIDDDWRLAARFNYSKTEDRLDALTEARFVEGNVGFAYRPVDNQRLGLFGRFSYLYDLSTIDQINSSDNDQRTRVLSLEGVYKLGRRWEAGLKLAQRAGEVRMTRGTGPWLDSATTFVAVQMRYDLRQQWHGLLEHRWLDVKDGGTRRGWLVGVDRDLSKNFRIGIGYNLTEFSDDLTDFDMNHRGWFINLLGSY